MKRRAFLRRLGMAGVASAVGAGDAWAAVTAGVRTGSSATVDSEALVQAADRHFMPGKKSCSESMLAAGCEGLGIESPLIPDIALGLAGGIGLQGKTCGVLTGGAMVASLALASPGDSYDRKKKRILDAAGDFCRRFEAEFGATDCRTLCGLDLTTPEGRKTMKARVKAQKCRPLVKGGAAILADVLKRCGAE